jgi:hypothetical protein
MERWWPEVGEADVLQSRARFGESTAPTGTSVVAKN